VQPDTAMPIWKGMYFGIIPDSIRKMLRGNKVNFAKNRILYIIKCVR